MDEDDNNEGEDLDDADPKSNQHAAPEYKRLITIHAGKPKGGLQDSFKVDPEKVRRLSLSEQQLEKAVQIHGKEIVRYYTISFCMFFNLVVARDLICACGVFHCVVLLECHHFSIQGKSLIQMVFLSFVLYCLVHRSSKLYDIPY